MKISRDPMKHAILFLFNVWLLLPSMVGAQMSFDARSVAMGSSNSADAQGLEQVGTNPATLALYRPFNFEFNLLTLNVSAYNNSITKGLYDRYFTTGDSLTQADKEEILGAIDASGLKGSFWANVNTLAFYTRNLSLSLAIMGNGFIQAPKVLFELPLKGNTELDRTYRFDDINGEGWLGLAATLGLSRPLELDFLENYFDFFAVGLSFKYLAGIVYAEVEQSRGEFFNGANYLLLDSRVSLREARGGKGIAFDLGFIGRYEDKWTVSLALMNPIGSIRWTKETQQRILTIRADSLSIPDRLADSLIVNADTSFAIDPFRTRLPVILDLAVAYRWSSDLLITGEYEQGLNRSMGGTTTPRLAAGVEYTIFPVIPLRAGISIGGKSGFTFAFGAGINLQVWYLDVAFMNRGSLFPGGSKGFTLAITSRFRF